MTETQTVTFDSGKSIEIPVCEDRIYALCWENGQLIEVLFYEEPQDGEDPSDRIHLLITPEGEKPRGWLMNVDDAISIIEGLSMGCRLAMKAGIPTQGEEQR